MMLLQKHQAVMGPARHRAPATVSRQCRSRIAVKILAFRPDSEHVAVPIDYYSILRVPRSAGPLVDKSVVLKSFEKLVRAAPASYSADTLFSRAVLLKSAAETLGSEELRRVYDQKQQLQGAGIVRVSQPDLPGALVLLQEVGQPSQVLQLATEWLARNTGSPDAADVATCAALAYCDRAATHLADVRDPLPQSIAASHGAESGAQNHVAAAPPDAAAESSKSEDGRVLVVGRVLPACQDLERALALVARYGVAQQLQGQISEALRDLAPEHALELLALPLDTTHSGQRAKGLRLLRSCLQRKGGDLEDVQEPTAQRAEELLGRARAHMTAAEQVELQPHLTSCPVNTAGVQYDTALALLAMAYSRGWPHLVHRADVLLQAVEAAAAASGEATAAYPVCVERCACAVMLGNVKGAQEMLGLRSGSPYPADPDVVAFVQEHSNGVEDLSPGLTLMSQRWLQSACLSVFRDSAAGAASATLPYWFAAGSVSTYLAVYNITRSTPILATAHLLTNFQELLRLHLAPILAAWTALAARLSPSAAQPAPVSTAAVNIDVDSTQRQPPPLPLYPDSTQATSAGAVMQQQERVQTATVRASVGPLGQAVPSRRARIAHAKGEDQQVAVPGGGLSRAGAALSQDRHEAVTAWELENDELGLDAELEAAYDDAITEDDPQSAAALSSQLDSLESAMWDAPDAGAATARTALLAKAAAVVAFAGAVVFIAARLLSGSSTVSANVQPEYATMAHVVSASDATNLTQTSAETLVRNWLAAKASALGPSHAIEAMEAILAGPALQQWGGEASRLADLKRGWQLRTHGVRVQRITITGSHEAHLDALVHESGKLVAQEGGKVEDSFNTKREVSYTARLEADGEWRLTAADA